MNNNRMALKSQFFSIHSVVLEPVFLPSQPTLFKIIYLFIWLRRVLVAAHGIFIAACSIFVAACRILSCSLQDLFWLRRAETLVAACATLSCGMWDLVPWPGIEPRPPALGAQSLSHLPTREVPLTGYNFHFIKFCHLSEFNIVQYKSPHIIAESVRI